VPGRGQAERRRRAGRRHREGSIHDFVIPDARRGTNAAQAAITQAIGVLRDAPHR